MKPLFGDIGVDVKGYTAESVYKLLEDQGLGGLFSNLRNTKPFNQNMYLQSAHQGILKDYITVIVRRDSITHITDMDTFLHILRVSILDLDAANGLVEELYLQDLIKPRNKL